MIASDAASSRPSEMPRVVLECRGVTKRFGGSTALEQVDFQLCAGEVHGLVGSNGAGKSTLMKILAGAVRPDEGTIYLDGEPVELGNPQAALRRGIAMVYQELSGVGSLSVAENLFLGRQPTGRFGRIAWRRMRQMAQSYLDELGIEVDVGRRLDTVPLVVQQMVEIARGLHSGARVLILDEPTSALSPRESERLFELIRTLRERGVAIVFISHFIEDVLAICDRVTILKDGRRLETTAAAGLDKHYVIHTMLGHALEEAEAGYERGARLPARATTPIVLSARGLTLRGVFDSVDLEVAAGECLGLYGFAGAGHQEVVHALAGAMRPEAGDVRIDGQPLGLRSPHEAIRRGAVLVAADRTKTLVHQAPIYQNVTLAHLSRLVGGWLTTPREIAVTAPLLEKVNCRPAEPRLRAGSLSGGNQQKVVVARWLAGPLKVLLLDEPTRGMDVGAKEEIMRLVQSLQASGAAVILASAEPEMLLAYAQRILVMHRGRVARELVDAEVDKAELMRYA